MHEKEFWSELGATGACTLRIAKGGAQPTLEGQKEGVKADAWFGSVTCADALGQHGFKSIMSVSKIILYFVYDDFANISPPSIFRSKQIAPFTRRRLLLMP